MIGARWTAFILVILASTSAVRAQNLTQYLSGNDLYDSCSQKSVHSTGYVEGVVDADLGRPWGYCVPVGVRADQLRDVVCRYLEAHPEARQQMAPNLIRSAFAEAWPCK